jgi:hypothetical protein
MPARWEDTIDMQLAIARGLDIQQRVQEAWASTEFGRRDDREWAARFVSLVHDWLGAAAPIYVAPDMAVGWQVAERAFAPEPLRESDLLVTTGFALLPEPVSITRLVSDDDPTAETGDLVAGQVRALVWGPVAGSGFDGRGEIGIAGLGVISEQPPELGFGDSRHPQAWIPVVRDGFAFGETYSRRDGTQRAFQAFWALLRQFVPIAERLPRARRRAAERAGRPTEVKIMRLRRAQAERNAGAGSIDYSCQWVVAGHWRNQPCGPERSERRQVFIAPYVKGPEDKPLRDPSRVLELVR